MLASSIADVYPCTSFKAVISEEPQNEFDKSFARASRTESDAC